MAHKDSVYETYDKIADWFDTHRSRDLFEKPYLDRFLSLLKSGAHILDIGCGMGEPIAQYFMKRGFKVTGIDGSQKLLDLAQERYPEGRFIRADMRNLALDQTFDGIIAWHSLFHLTQEAQRDMFHIFATHLKPGGILMFTSGYQADEQWGDNGGEMLYHASLSTEEYRDLLKKNSFEIDTHVVQDKECGDATVWIAYKEKTQLTK